jgi:hypothetical protein
VFPLLLSACVAGFTPQDTLALWDRVIGFNSLLPLAVVAAAVLVVRCGPFHPRFMFTWMLRVMLV